MGSVGGQGGKECAPDKNMQQLQEACSPTLTPLAQTQHTDEPYFVLDKLARSLARSARRARLGALGASDRPSDARARQIVLASPGRRGTVPVRRGVGQARKRACCLFPGSSPSPCSRARPGRCRPPNRGRSTRCCFSRIATAVLAQAHHVQRQPLAGGSCGLFWCWSRLQSPLAQTQHTDEPYFVEIISPVSELGPAKGLPGCRRRDILTRHLHTICARTPPRTPDTAKAGPRRPDVDETRCILLVDDIHKHSCEKPSECLGLTSTNELTSR